MKENGPQTVEAQNPTKFDTLKRINRGRDNPSPDQEGVARGGLTGRLEIQDESKLDGR
jgi:hypothetical protein